MFNFAVIHTISWIDLAHDRIPTKERPLMRHLTLTLVLMVLATTAMAQGTTITGFADASYLYNTHDINGEFSLDQVEINIIHQSSEKTLVRADLEWIKDGEDMVAQVEQAFMTYTTNRGWGFTFGKFNAPIGFEEIDPVDMYQFSHSLVYEFGAPTNLTGASIAKDFGPGFDIIGHVSNGWDRNTMAGANVTWGGRLGYSNGGFGGGFAAISGKEDSIPENEEDPAMPFTRTVYDIDLSFETGMWLFGGEVNMGKVTQTMETGDVDQEWNGFLVMTHLDYASWTGLTVRYDYFDDQDGYAFGGVMNGDELEYQKVQSITICPTFNLDENFGALVELRIDKSNRSGAFEDKDGEATDTNTTIAFEATYSW